MLLHTHSGFRYLVLLAGLALIGYSVYALVTKREYDKRVRVLSAIFTASIDVTVIFGMIYLFTGVYRPQLGGHLVMMVLAAVLAHAVHRVMKRRPPESQTFMPHIVGTLIVLCLIAAGTLAIGRPIVG
jgi:hypothetical protein